MLIKRGAEAELHRETWMGRDVAVKVRVPKSYRNPALDELLRKRRTKLEAKLLAEARAAGVPTPLVYDADLGEYRLVMEYLEGERVKEALIGPDMERCRKICRKIGCQIARLHGKDIAHGDLTTSNMILARDRLYFIDFSLGDVTPEVEAKGVDLHLLKETFEGSHTDRAGLFGDIVAGYLEENPKGKEVVEKLEEIRKRGRYARA